MGYFHDINFEYTEDGSVGLFDSIVGDIFHSRSGALKEANEKFTSPVLHMLSHFSENINVLDICYGIGYNTKSIINLLNGYNLKIDALEFNKNYVFLSPFINDGIDDNDLKIYILSEIFRSIKNSNDLDNIIMAIFDKDYKKYTSSFFKQFFESFSINKDVQIDSGLLHNIYYQYVSERMESYLKPNKYKDSFINFFIGDARKSIFKTTNLYDVIFLDSFSPQKDPTLWTIDFLSILKSKMKQNSILISYSKSVPFRSALLELGFNVGKNILENNEIGTIASINSDLVHYKLDKDDLAVINTRSGIPYRDINLNLNPTSIIINRSIEGAASTRISRTQYDKKFL